MRVVLLGVDDWEGLFIDGTIRDQTHSLSLHYTLELISKAINEHRPDSIRTFEYEHAFYEPKTQEDREYLEYDFGQYPERLEDVDPKLREGISV